MSYKIYKDHIFKNDTLLSNEYIVNELNDLDYYKQEIENLHSIIKEAREYIQDRYDGEALTHTFDKDNVKEILEILDKVEEK